MNIQPVVPSFTGGNATYRILKNSAQNAAKPYFENEVLNIIRDQQLPATIMNGNFNITLDSSFELKKMFKFENTLNKAGIKFRLIV